MMAPVLGIDLGTTNSVVSLVQGNEVHILRDADGDELIPSVVSFHESGEIMVGKLARYRRLVDAQNTIYSIKRLIGRPYDSDELRRAQERFPFSLVEGAHGAIRVRARDSDYALQEISAFVLAHIRTVAAESLGVACRDAVITVPASFNELQRSATKSAGFVAGLNVLRVINEPTAAALAYGQDRRGRERVAVYDLGGGTFDITILELAGDVYEVVSTAGDSFLGGDDVDLLIADQFCQAFLELQGLDPRSESQAYERVRAAAEWAKCSLAEKDTVEVRLERLMTDNSGNPLDMQFALRRDDMERAVRPILERSFDVCERAMATAGLRPTHLDNVILVGGSTRMNLVRQMVTEYFGREPMDDIDPDVVVSQGAAIHAAALAGLAEPPPLDVPTARSGRAEVERAQRERAVQEALPEGPAFAPREQRYVPPPPLPRKKAGHEEQLRHSHRPGALPDLPPPSQPPPALPPGADDMWDFQPIGEPQQPREMGAIELASSEELEPIDEPQQRHELGAIELISSEELEPIDEPQQRYELGAIELVSSEELEPIELEDATEESSVPAVLQPAAVMAAGQAATAGATPSRMEERPAPLHVPDGPPPLLLDVTSHSLGLETAGGFCEQVIERNQAIPVENTRIFSTARDGQDTVAMRICQGESRRFEENQPLGEFELSGLPSARRGALRIHVTFMLDQDGSLNVSARDADTGSSQSIRVKLIGGVDEGQLEEMRQRHQQIFEG